jgi:hypothetical protein
MKTLVNEKARVPRFEPPYFRGFFDLKKPNKPIQALSHPRPTDTAYQGTDTPTPHRQTAYPGTDTPKTHPLPLARGCRDSLSGMALLAHIL